MVLVVVAKKSTIQAHHMKLRTHHTEIDFREFQILKKKFAKWTKKAERTF